MELVERDFNTEILLEEGFVVIFSLPLKFDNCCLGSCSVKLSWELIFLLQLSVMWGCLAWIFRGLSNCRYEIDKPSGGKTFLP